jgi:hypothetical protein
VTQTRRRFESFLQVGCTVRRRSIRFGWKKGDLGLDLSLEGLVGLEHPFSRLLGGFSLHIVLLEAWAEIYSQGVQLLKWIYSCGGSRFHIQLKIFIGGGRLVQIYYSLEFGGVMRP